jgi:hypothetical protein
LKAVKIKQLPRLVDPSAIERTNQEIVALKGDEEALSKFIDDRADEFRKFSLRIFVADGDPDGLRIVERFNASARPWCFRGRCCRR